MSEPIGTELPPEAAPNPSTGPSAGAQLRAAREAAGVHISALAVSLKVPVKKLEALEADDLEQLPDAVFARALAASVCRTLKIDPEPVLQQLPQVHVAPMPVGGHGEPVRLDNHRDLRLSASFSLPKPVLVISALLLLGALVVLLLPAIRDTGFSVTDGEVTTVVPTPVLPPATVATLPEPVASDAIAATPALEGASAAVAQPAQAASVPAVPEAAPEPTAVAVFNARAQAWVQVQGADGVVHLRKTLDAGESVSINGALPLSVVLGRADAVDVMVRGKPFDAQPLTKDNVARFQIK